MTLLNKVADNCGASIYAFRTSFPHNIDFDIASADDWIFVETECIPVADTKSNWDTHFEGTSGRSLEGAL